MAYSLVFKRWNISLVPRLLPSFLSHTVQKTVFCTVCDKKLGRSLGTRLVEYDSHHFLLVYGETICGS